MCTPPLHVYHGNTPYPTLSPAPPFQADALERLFSQVPTMTHWDVRRCFGAQGRSTAVGTATIFVCTMERANSIANKWLQGGELHKLCCVVVDELHMVGLVGWIHECV